MAQIMNFKLGADSCRRWRASAICRPVGHEPAPVPHPRQAVVPALFPSQGIDNLPMAAGRALLAHARPPAENHPRGNALVRRARPVGLLRGLSLQPFDRDQRRPMARPCPAVRSRTEVHLSGLRPPWRRCQAAVCGRQAVFRVSRPRLSPRGAALFRGNPPYHYGARELATAPGVCLLFDRFVAGWLCSQSYLKCWCSGSSR
jgi:hypothetical protein